jgi:hypothetical protein
LSFSVTLHLNAEELKSPFKDSDNETPKRVESLRDAPIFPYKKTHKSFFKTSTQLSTLKKHIQQEQEQTSLGMEKEAGSKEAA